MEEKNMKKSESGKWLNLKMVKAPIGTIVKGFYNSKTTAVQVRTGNYTVQTDEDVMPVFIGSIILVFTKTHGGYNFSVIQQHTNIQEVLFSCFFHYRELEKYENNYYFQEYNDFIQDCLKKF